MNHSILQIFDKIINILAKLPQNILCMFYGKTTDSSCLTNKYSKSKTKRKGNIKR